MGMNTTLVINAKGGVGKTTITTNLASFFASRNVRDDHCRLRSAELEPELGQLAFSRGHARFTAQTSRRATAPDSPRHAVRFRATRSN